MRDRGGGRGLQSREGQINLPIRAIDHLQTTFYQNWANYNIYNIVEKVLQWFCLKLANWFCSHCEIFQVKTFDCDDYAFHLKKNRGDQGMVVTLCFPRVIKTSQKSKYNGRLTPLFFAVIVINHQKCGCKVACEGCGVDFPCC